MTKTAQQLVDGANAEIETITAEQAIEEMTNPDVMMVDLRDIRELEREGMVAKVYADYAKRASVLADLIEDGDGILTNCFAETSFILGIAMASGQGKDIHVYAPETRPYLQGARLTAPSIQELGVKVTLVTDNMPAHHHCIPYFPIAWGMDEKSRTKKDINIELREAEIRKSMGQATTLDSIDAYYPAFDITPPELVAGVISTQGVLSPCSLKGASL